MKFFIINSSSNSIWTNKTRIGREIKIEIEKAVPKQSSNESNQKTTMKEKAKEFVPLKLKKKKKL